MPNDGAERPRDPSSTWRQILAAPEGKILLTGVILTCLYVAAVVLSSWWSGEVFRDLVTMTTTHIIGGRAAGVSWGYAHQLPPWAVILANMAIETILVMFAYPLFVFSYHKLLIIGPLKDSMARARRAAETHQKQIMKYGIPGLFLFVWFPFWMTGPVVGSIIGFLIGLRPWVNMLVVLAGTDIAILCWGVVLKKLQNRLEAMGPYVPFVFVGLVLFVAVAVHIRQALARNSEKAPAGSNQPEE